MIASFPPIVNDQTEILILGTMPGAMSLEKQEYYAYPQNQFWKIMFTLLAALPVSSDFSEKIGLLQHNNIGLWDILANCERKGSLDIHIKNQTENDIENLLRQHPKIKTILFNGKESLKYFDRKFRHIEGIRYHVMRSTSPANTVSFAKKLEAWREVLDK